MRSYPSQIIHDPAGDLESLARQMGDLQIEPGTVTSTGNARSRETNVKSLDEPVLMRKALRLRVPSPPPRPRKALCRLVPAGRGRGLDTDPLTTDKHTTAGKSEGEHIRASQQRGSSPPTPFRRPITPDAFHESPRAQVSILPAHERFAVVIEPEFEHSVMWDPADDGTLPWAGTIFVYDSQPWLCLDERGPIRGVHISFHLVVPPPRNNTAASAPDEWHVSYTGLRDVAQLSVERRIAIEKHIIAEESKEDWCTASVWHVPFWVPVPNDLFARAEYRAFVCKALVTVEDDYTPEMVVQADDVPVGIDRLRTWQIFEGAHPPPPARG